MQSKINKRRIIQGKILLYLQPIKLMMHIHRLHNFRDRVNQLPILGSTHIPRIENTKYNFRVRRASLNPSNLICEGASSRNLLASSGQTRPCPRTINPSSFVTFSTPTRISRYVISSYAAALRINRHNQSLNRFRMNDSEIRFVIMRWISSMNAMSPVGSEDGGVGKSSGTV